MDEKGGIYSLDFKFITNMEDNKIEIDDDWKMQNRGNGTWSIIEATFKIKNKNKLHFFHCLI